jgi:c-di-GMP-binding flagellar brake protein YcgR
MLIYIMIGLIPALGLLVLMMNRSTKDSPDLPISRTQFYIQGKAAGFSPKEVSILKNIAVHAGLAEYTALFQNPNLLNLCIRTLVQSWRASGDDDPAKQHFLTRLYEYRKKLELEIGPDQKITSSRQINEGQNIRIVIDNSAIYYAKVIKNTYQYLLITRPSNPKISASLSWTDQKFAIYFWREEDAGYVFDCEVLDEVYIKNEAALQVSHSDSLFRVQKRKSIRIRTHKPAFLYILTDTEPSNKLEVIPGLKCIIGDLSDTGCSVTIGGKANRGMRVKLQFALNKVPLNMGGIVRYVEYNEETNRSQIHIEADPLRSQAKNSIFEVIFRVLPENDNFLSPRP